MNPKVTSPVQQCPNKKQSQSPGSQEKKWVKFLLQDEGGKPMPNVRFTVVLPDESFVEACSDDKGMVEIADIDAGNCKIESEWKKHTVDKTVFIV